jgi:hypothetical protein
MVDFDFDCLARSQLIIDFKFHFKKQINIQAAKKLLKFALFLKLILSSFSLILRLSHLFENKAGPIIAIFHSKYRGIIFIEFKFIVFLFTAALRQILFEDLRIFLKISLIKSLTLSKFSQKLCPILKFFLIISLFEEEYLSDFQQNLIKSSYKNLKLISIKNNFSLIF